jgi:hypothetical protein
VRLGKVRVEFDRPLRADDRGCRIAGAALGAREVNEGFSKSRIDDHGPRQHRDRLRQVAGVLQDDAQQVERVGMIGLLPQNAAVDHFSLGEPASFMVCQSGVEFGVHIICFGHRCRASAGQLSHATLEHMHPDGVG